MFLLLAVLIPVGALLLLAGLSTLGLEADQGQVKRAFRWLGPLAIAYGLGAGSWFYIVGGGIALLISHPRINLHGLTRRVDSALGGGADSPARHVP
jgi:hypothetical protein